MGMSTKDRIEAAKLYREFWEKYPEQKNPTDINTLEKAFFFVQKGFDKIKLMQRARKQGFDFTRRQMVLENKW